MKLHLPKADSSVLLLIGVLHQDKDLKTDAIADMVTATDLAPTHAAVNGFSICF